MKNYSLTIYVFLNIWSFGRCNIDLSDYEDGYEEPRVYIQTQNYTINLFPLMIPLAAFTLGKIIQFRVCRVITNPAGSVIFR